MSEALAGSAAASRLPSAVASPVGPAGEQGGVGSREPSLQVPGAQVSVLHFRSLALPMSMSMPVPVPVPVPVLPCLLRSGGGRGA